MKEISYQSLHKIRDIIPGQNYSNIKARLDQYLPAEFSSVFAKVNFAAEQASWFGEDNIDYLPYANASDMEKEEIATALEECKQYVCENLKVQMPFIEKIFIIPSTNEIFWYRDDSGIVRVTVAQWGFQLKQLGQNVDIIDLLIGSPRVLTQEEVTVKFFFTDGEIARNVPFILNIFNNRKECEANDEGEYYIGKIHVNRTFSIEDISGKTKFDFTVAKDAQYNVTFERGTTFNVKVENQHGQPKALFAISVDNLEVHTDENGGYKSEYVILTPGKTVTVSLPDGSTPQTYVLSRDETENEFTFTVHDEEVIPPLPPEPPKNVTVRILTKKGNAIANVPFVVLSNGKKITEGITDNNGVGTFPADMLKHGQKYKIDFRVTSEQEKNTDNKTKNTDKNGQK